MLFDILAVFVVTFISTLLLCTTTVHGLPASPSTIHLIRSHPSADLSSSLRLLSHHPVPSVDYDLGGDISEMLIGENNELLATTDDDTPTFSSSLDASNEPFKFYLDPSSSSSSSKSLSRKLLLLLQKEREDEQYQKQKQQQQQQKKRSTQSSSLATQFNLKSAMSGAAFNDPSQSNSVVNLNQLSESGRLSPSLKVLVETNPFARAWLTMLLQKVMEEQPTPYIFKYGRRRK